MRGLLASGALIGYLLGACAKDFDAQSIAVIGGGNSAATCAFCVGNEGTCFGNPQLDACLTWYHAVCPDTCASVRPDSVGPATGAGVAGLDYSKDSDKAYSLFAKALGNDIPTCDAIDLQPGNQFNFFNCAADTMTNLFCPASCNAMFELDTCTGTTDTVGYADPQLGRSCEQWANACSRQNAGQIDDCSQISADVLVLNGLTSATCTPGGWLSDGGKYYAKSIMDDIRGNCPVACYTCHDDVNQPVHARKDPHLHLAHGGRADFRGLDNTTFSFLSAKNLSLNVRIEKTDLMWKHTLVHGTRMAAAYWAIRSAATGRMLQIELVADQEMGVKQRHAYIHEAGKASITLSPGGPVFEAENVRVGLALENARPRLTVTVAQRWNMSATISAFPFAKANAKKVMLDVDVKPLYNVDTDTVAPHGIFGQSYDGDGFAVDGAVDAGKGDEFTTTAQAEGAIEGTFMDYVVKTKFATDFKFSRFDKLAARPRDATKLSGHKHRIPKSSGPAVAGAHDVRDQE